MADDPQPRGIVSYFQSELITVLLAVALLLGIATEGLTIFRQYIGAETDLQNLAKAEAETPVAIARAKGLMQNGLHNITIIPNSPTQQPENQLPGILENLRKLYPAVSDDRLQIAAKKACIEQFGVPACKDDKP